MHGPVLSYGNFTLKLRDAQVAKLLEVMSECWCQTLEKAAFNTAVLSQQILGMTLGLRHILHSRSLEIQAIAFMVPLRISVMGSSPSLYVRWGSHSLKHKTKVNVVNYNFLTSCSRFLGVARLNIIMLDSVLSKREEKLTHFATLPLDRKQTE